MPCGLGFGPLVKWNAEQEDARLIEDAPLCCKHGQECNATGIPGCEGPSIPPREGPAANPLIFVGRWYAASQGVRRPVKMALDSRWKVRKDDGQPMSLRAARKRQLFLDKDAGEQQLLLFMT